ncbi:MAG: NAD(P)/FAD-dependent oxidoreductase [Phycisphaerales bacterium]
MDPTLDIAVVGAGIGGLAAAGLLASQGHRVRVFEQSPTPGPLGAGLLLQPTGQYVLGRLGLDETLRSLAAPVHRLEGRNHRGRTIMDLAYADLARWRDRGGAGGARAVPHGFGVHRGALFTMLRERAEQAGAVIVPGTRISDIERDATDNHYWRLLAANLAEGTDDAPQRLGERFDLVIVADGSRSALRARLCPGCRAKPYPWGAVWFVAEDNGGAFEGALRQVYRSTTSMVGWLPTGLAAPGGARTVSVFWSAPASQIDSIRAADIGAWRRDVLALAPELAPLVVQIDSPASLIPATYMDVDAPLSPRPGIVLLGDAAHAMSPQLGQGANLALLDAWALARSLEAALRVAQVPVAMAAIQRKLGKTRRGQVRFYQRASRWMTPWFQSGLAPLAWPRDLLMGPLCRAPFVRRQMLLSLAGVKTGVLRSMPVPDAGNA